MESHLNDEQIEELLHRAHGNMHRSLEERAIDERLRGHLQTCTECQSRLIEARMVMDQLAHLSAPYGTPRGLQCPSDDVWIEIATGVFNLDSENYVSHAAHCDHCGPLLHQAIAHTADDLIPEEEAGIAGLPSSRPAWQHSFAAKLRGTRVQKASTLRRPTLLRWAVAGGLAASVLVAAVVLGRGRWSPSPERLIANAYVERRTVEIQIEGVPYVPLSQERGGNADESRMSRPALLKAEAEIAKQLETHPDAVQWLQASGRASLLEDDPGSPDAAVDILKRAQDLAPDDRSVSIDLASAYLLRGQVFNRQSDIGLAVDTLGKVLSVDGRDEAAQFNYAIALQSMMLYGQAAVAWQNFIDKNPASPWTKEAREHLDRVEQELQSRNVRSKRPLESPEQLATAISSGRPDRVAEIDARVEDYADLAVEQWLPQYFSLGTRPGGKEGTVKRGLLNLALILRNDHSDEWLMDLMRADSRSPNAIEAVQRLGNAVRLIRTSDDDQAQQEAVRSLHLFNRAHIPSGAVRAEFELALIDQLRHRKRSCEDRALGLLRNSTLRRYTWLWTQVELEVGICASTTNEEARRDMHVGHDMASAYHYPALSMRAIAGEVELSWELGDRQSAWHSSTEGLQQFWQGTLPVLRGYSILVSLDDLVSQQRQTFLETAILREALQMVKGDSRRNMVAFEQARLGQVLLEAGDLNGAEKCFRGTEALFAEAKPGIQRDTLKAEADLGFAKVDFTRGQSSAASHRLDVIRNALAGIPDDRLASDFFQSSGMVRLSLHDLVRAEQDLTTAMALSEKGLSLADTDFTRLRWSQQNQSIYRGMVRLRLLQNRPKDALLEWEWYKGAALRGHSGARPSTRQNIAPDTAMLSYAVFDDGIALWVSDQNGVREQWINMSEGALADAARRFVDHCSDPHSDPNAIRREGRSLYQQILQPVEPWLAERHHLIVEPDDALRIIPFDLLIDSDGAYLSDRHSLTLSLGVDYLSLDHGWTGISATSDAVIIGDPAVAGWAPLPDAEREARAVAGMFEHPHLIIHTGLSPHNLSREVAEAQVLHFAGHAEASFQSAGLKDGAMNILEPFRFDSAHRGRNQLVVLSACTTSSGTTGFFDDEDSLVRELAGARVPEVVASRWTVDSTVTASLMKYFYAEVLAGRPVSEALGTAMHTVRTEPRFSHPYYWAGFSAFGSS